VWLAFKPVASTTNGFLLLADGFYFVAVEVADVGGIVVGVVLSTDAGCAFVSAALGDRGGVKGINGSAIGGTKGEVKAGRARYIRKVVLLGVFRVEPEGGLVSVYIGSNAAIAHRKHAVNTQRFERRIVKSETLVEVYNANREMVEHSSENGNIALSLLDSRYPAGDLVIINNRRCGHFAAAIPT